MSRRRYQAASPPVFSRSHALWLWGVFCFSVAVRFFRVSRPMDAHLDEPRLMFLKTEPFYQNCSTSYMPYLGYMPFLWYEQEYRLDFRWWNAILGSFIPVVACAIIQQYGINGIVAFTASMLIGIEHSAVVTSRSWNLQTPFWLLAEISVLFATIAGRKNSYRMALVSALFAGLSCLMDFTGLAVCAYLVVVIIRGKMEGKGKKVVVVCAIVVLFCLMDIAYQFAFIDECASKRMTKTLKRVGKRMISAQRWYHFLLWKMRPRIIWRYRDMRLVMVNNPVTVLLSTLVCSITILKRESAFYFATVVWIWLLKGNGSCRQYQLALTFGVTAIAKGLDRLPLKWLFASAIVVGATAFFVLLSSVIYVLKLEGSYKELVDSFK